MDSMQFNTFPNLVIFICSILLWFWNMWLIELSEKPIPFAFVILSHILNQQVISVFVVYHHTEINNLIHHIPVFEKWHKLFLALIVFDKLDMMRVSINPLFWRTFELETASTLFGSVEEPSVAVYFFCCLFKLILLSAVHQNLFLSIFAVLLNVYDVLVCTYLIMNFVLKLYS